MDHSLNPQVISLLNQLIFWQSLLVFIWCKVIILSVFSTISKYALEAPSKVLGLIQVALIFYWNWNLILNLFLIHDFRYMLMNWLLQGLRRKLRYHTSRQRDLWISPIHAIFPRLIKSILVHWSWVINITRTRQPLPLTTRQDLPNGVLAILTFDVLIPPWKRKDHLTIFSDNRVWVLQNLIVINFLLLISILLFLCFILLRNIRVLYF